MGERQGPLVITLWRGPPHRSVGLLHAKPVARLSGSLTMAPFASFRLAAVTLTSPVEYMILVK